MVAHCHPLCLFNTLAVLVAAVVACRTHRYPYYAHTLDADLFIAYDNACVCRCYSARPASGTTGWN